jgi:signal transduction histidine kinase
MAEEALRFAAQQGRDTRAALERLVVVMGDTAPDNDPDAQGRLCDLIDGLAAGMARVGQRVTLRIGEEPPGLPVAVTASAYAIVREALTNSLRYAPGAEVSVWVRYRPTSVEIAIEDNGTDSAAAVAPLVPSSGRGIAGMRERATLVGGDLSAGARPGGGWSVSATLPIALAGARSPRTARWPVVSRIVNVCLIIALAFLPAAFAFENEPSLYPDEPRPMIMLAVLMLLRALPLLWRRRSPWIVLSAVLASLALWPTAVWFGLAPSFIAAFLPGFCPDVVAVYSVAAYGGRARSTWPAAPGSALAVGAAFVGCLAVDGVHLMELGDTFAWITAFQLLVASLPAWGIGLAIRSRRERVVARERGAVDAMAAKAIETARQERERIAAELREAVLDHTRRLIDVADAGCRQLSTGERGPTAPEPDQKVAEVTAHARAALAAMRELLTTLRRTAGPATLTPQPSASGIADLCRARSGDGRTIDVTVSGDVRPLPAATDVSAFRIVETALSAGDSSHVMVGVRYGPSDLSLTISGVPAATDGLAAAGLRARAEALGGHMEMSGSVTIEISLPARDSERTDVKEVASWQSA